MDKWFAFLGKSWVIGVAIAIVVELFRAFQRKRRDGGRAVTVSVGEPVAEFHPDTSALLELLGQMDSTSSQRGSEPFAKSK